jgi:hypothetical protein
MAEEQPREATDDRPKIFKNMTAWIGGATAVIVALGGFLTAFGGLLRNDSRHADAKAETVQHTPSASDPDVGSQPSEEEVPASYKTGGGGTLKWVDGMWVWTDKDGTFHYKEVSNDGTTTVAKLPGGGENGEDVWLRWPNAGGQAFQSFDDQKNWNEPVEVTPVD